MGTFNVDLETGDRFWTPQGLGALGMDPNRAIAELVANALDWRKVDGSKTEITIVIGPGFIEVRDNGVGMTKSELLDGIKVSVSDDNTRNSLRIRKGMFGMGMKVACLTLGWKINFRTRSINETNKENTLTLDTRKFENPNLEYRKNITGKTSGFDLKSTLGDSISGTSIIIEDLTYKRMLGVSIRDSLQEVFKPEISIENVEIKVVDKNKDETFVCEKTEVSIISGSRINLDDLNLLIKDTKTGKNFKIKGWVGLMTISRPSGDWGLHLYKNSQIIERFHQLPIRLGGLLPKNPHAEFSRAYGEIELDMCSPSFHKVGFDYSTPEWEAVQNSLKDILTEILEASRTYKKSDEEKKEDAIKKVQKRRKASQIAADKLKSHVEDENKPEEAITLSDGRWFTIVSPTFKELQEIEVPWIYNFSKESSELLVIINTRSPIFVDIEGKQYNDELMLTVVNWAISECMLYLLIEEFDFNEREAFNFRNSQLTKLYKSSNDE